MLATALLIAALAATLLFLRSGRGADRSYRRLTATRDRRRRYRRWIGRAWAAFGLTSLVALALLGRLGAVVTLPGEFASIGASMPQLRGSPPAFVAGLLSGAAIGAVVAGVAYTLRRRRGSAAPRPAGAIGAMLPRNRAEIVHAAAMAVTAGIVEELFFRLVLPLLIAIVMGEQGYGALPGFVVATALFGAMHLYQGWIGVVATTLVGGLLAVVYLGSGALWVAMLLHALMDLGGLVLRPVLAGTWRQVE